MMPPAQDHRGRSWKRQEGPSLEPRRGRGRERGLGLDVWPQDSERMISVVLGPIYQYIRGGFSRQPWDTKPHTQHSLEMTWQTAGLWGHVGWTLSFQRHLPLAVVAAWLPFLRGWEGEAFRPFLGREGASWTRCQRLCASPRGARVRP